MLNDKNNDRVKRTDRELPERQERNEAVMDIVKTVNTNEDIDQIISKVSFEIPNYRQFIDFQNFLRLWRHLTGSYIVTVFLCL